MLGATGTAPRVAARARLSTPSRCVPRAFTQSVRGTGIKRVTFAVNGRRVAQVSGTRSVYAVRINPQAYATGTLRITARVEYVAASGKRAQTLRATALRCSSRAAANPRFAG